MTPVERICKFHWCCQEIVKAGRDIKQVKQVNYAYNWAANGATITDPEEIHMRSLKLLNNITHWRGPIAKKVRAALKTF